MMKAITYKSILLVALPIILESLAQNVLNITDTAFMGRVGETSLGAAAIGSVFYFAFIMIAFGLGIGSQIIIARRVGENKSKAVGKVFVQTQYILVLIALSIFILLKLSLPILLEQIVESDDIRQEALKYLSLRIYGFFPAFLNVSFRAFFVGIAKTKVITYTTIIMTLVNIVLNYLLIFGNYGFPELGIKGAAIASVCAEITALIFFAIFTLIKVPHRNYLLFEYSRISSRLVRRILKISYPLMLQYFVSLSCWFTFFIFIEKMGSLELAVSNIIRSVYIFMLLPIWGFSATVNTFVSQYIGKGQPDELWKILKKAIFLCIPMCMILIIPMAMFPNYVLSFFTDDINIINSGISVYYVVLGTAPFLAVAILLFSALTGTGMTKISLLIEIFVLCVYMYFAWMVIIKLKLNLEIAWTVEYLYALMMGIASYLYLRFGKWRDNKI